MAMNGVLDHNGRDFTIPELKPHVRIRLKQVFPGVPSAAQPPYRLRESPAIAADLDWFMQRYPLTVLPAARARLDLGLAEHAKLRRHVDDLSRPDYQPGLVTGFREPEKPFPYQVRAAEMLRATGRLLLMDHVGLGKTVSALAAISDGWGLPAAIVVQPHLSRQWLEGYIKRFTHLRAVEVTDRQVRNLPPADVYIFRYSNIGAWGTYAQTLGCKTLILDEVQELRHGLGTDKGMGAAAFAAEAENVLGLTATPIYNYGGEIYSVLEFIAPGALGSWDEFTRNWCRMHGNHWVVDDPRALGSYLRDEAIVLRRTIEDAEVAQTLPPLRKMVVEVGWNEGDVESDRDLQRILAQRVISGSFTQRGQAARELDMMLRRETGIAKARAVAAYVRNLVEEGERVLLAGWHRDVYDIWNRSLADLNPVMFTGSESQPQKQKAKEAFCGGNARVMMMSLRSGAGIDGLQHHATQVVYGELDWSPQVHVQFTGRLHRTGQTKPVTAHYLHVDGGSDPAILDVLGLKASQASGIVDPFDDVLEATPSDTNRMTALAQSVLSRIGGAQ